MSIGLWLLDPPRLQARNPSRGTPSSGRPLSRVSRPLAVLTGLIDVVVGRGIGSQQLLWLGMRLPDLWCAPAEIILEDGGDVVGPGAHEPPREDLMPTQTGTLGLSPNGVIDLAWNSDSQISHGDRLPGRLAPVDDFLGEGFVRMNECPASSALDEEVAARATCQYRVPTSAAFVRTLRHCDVLPMIGGGPDSGGRGKLATYGEEAAFIVAMVGAAKSDPSYKRKLHRAVLIAWARGTHIETPGLRWAFCRHYKVECRTADRTVGKQQIKERDAAFPELGRGSFQLALAKAMLGQRLSPEALEAMERASGSRIHELAWRVGNPDLVSACPDAGSLGLVTQRSDGSWRVEEPGKRLWEALGLAPKKKLALTAPREELDAARAHVRPTFGLLGLECSDLLVATCVPAHCLEYRQSFGEHWWESSDPERQPPFQE